MEGSSAALTSSTQTSKMPRARTRTRARTRARTRTRARMSRLNATAEQMITLCQKRTMTTWTRSWARWTRRAPARSWARAMTPARRAATGGATWTRSGTGLGGPLAWGGPSLHHAREPWASTTPSLSRRTRRAQRPLFDASCWYRT